MSLARAILWTLAALAVLVALTACGRSQGASAPTPTPTPAPTATVQPSPTSMPAATEVATPTPAPASEVRGFSYPIAGACLTSSPNLLPNASRADYRPGLHEGIDFYDGLACAAIVKGTPVLAAKGGLVERAGLGYVEMTPEERDHLLTISQEQGYTDAATLDRFRGRQVWINHGGGIVTRYAHLGGIAEGIDVGVYVEAGQTVGFVGNSGTPEGVSDPNLENHLHFEIRVGDSYLGQGLSEAQVVALLEQAFSP